MGLPLAKIGAAAPSHYFRFTTAVFPRKAIPIFMIGRGGQF